MGGPPSPPSCSWLRTVSAVPPKVPESETKEEMYFSRQAGSTNCCRNSAKTGLPSEKPMAVTGVLDDSAYCFSMYACSCS